LVLILDDAMPSNLLFKAIAGEQGVISHYQLFVVEFIFLRLPEFSYNFYLLWLLLN
jgi:hypothetical protein